MSGWVWRPTMSLEIKVLTSPAEFSQLAEAWNSLVREDAEDLLGLDGTSRFEWYEAILDAFPEAIEPRVVVAWKDGQVQGILPVIASPAARLSLLAPTELYGGRNGFLLARPDSEILAALLGGLDQAMPGWVSLRLTLVEGSASETVLLDAQAKRGYRLAPGPTEPSPFYAIRASSAEFLEDVAKDLRQKIKINTRKLEALGSVKILEYSKEAQADALLQAVLAIERQSWKQSAGTAISCMPQQERFYRRFFPQALRAGILFARVICLNDEPIAYNFGLCVNKVFSSLKISQVEHFEKVSPSHQLNLELINALRNTQVSYYDCMGKPELHKSRWSKATQQYSRCSYQVFNQSHAGRLAFFSNILRVAATRAKRKFTGLLPEAIKSE